MSYPKVGIGVILVNEQGQILVGKRKGSHAPYWSIPGGNLELGESFEQAAQREVFEETGLAITNPKVFAITNNLRTYKECGLHYISVCLVAEAPNSRPENREPHKCEGWVWTEPTDLPQPHFDASEESVACYLRKTHYLGE